MAKPSLQDIDTTDTFQIWLNSTNEIINIVRTETVTASVLGDTTGSVSSPLKSTLIGEFTANTVNASDLLRASSISPKIGSSEIEISAPITVNSTVKNTAIFSSSVGARTRYSGSAVSWDMGLESNAVPDFIIDSGTGNRKFALKRSGDLSIAGGFTVGLSGQDRKIRLNSSLGPTSHAFISKAFSGPAFTAEATGLRLTGAIESVVDDPTAFFLWCSYGAIDSFVGGIKPNENGTGALFVSGTSGGGPFWRAGISENNSDFIINTTAGTQQLKLSPAGDLTATGNLFISPNNASKRIRLNNSIDINGSHAFISKAFAGPALTAEGTGLGSTGAIESVVNNPQTLFLWCSYGAINSFIGGIASNSSGNGVLYLTSSDYRLKTDIQHIDQNYSEILRKIPVRKFKFKNEKTHTTGFVAHELQEHVPEAVSGNKDEIDSDGKPIYQGVDNSRLVPLLTASLQEILLKMDALEKRLEAVEHN